MGSSIVLDNFGNPWISYGDTTDTVFHLKVAHFTGTTWEISQVDPTGDRATAIAMDLSGNPCIAYQQDNGVSPCVQYAKRFGESNRDIQTVDENAISYYGFSLVIDAVGNPHIAYTDGSDPFSLILKYASRTGSTWSVETIPGECAFQEQLHSNWIAWALLT